MSTSNARWTPEREDSVSNKLQRKMKASPLVPVGRYCWFCHCCRLRFVPIESQREREDVRAPDSHPCCCAGLCGDSYGFGGDVQYVQRICAAAISRPCQQVGSGPGPEPRTQEVYPGSLHQLWRGPTA